MILGTVGKEPIRRFVAIIDGSQHWVHDSVCANVHEFFEANAREISECVISLNRWNGEEQLTYCYVKYTKDFVLLTWEEYIRAYPSSAKDPTGAVKGLEHWRGAPIVVVPIEEPLPAPKSQPLVTQAEAVAINERVKAHYDKAVVDAAEVGSKLDAASAAKHKGAHNPTFTRMPKKSPGKSDVLLDLFRKDPTRSMESFAQELYGNPQAAVTVTSLFIYLERTGKVLRKGGVWKLAS